MTVKIRTSYLEGMSEGEHPPRPVDRPCKWNEEASSSFMERSREFMVGAHQGAYKVLYISGDYGAGKSHLERYWRDVINGYVVAPSDFQYSGEGVAYAAHIDLFPDDNWDSILQRLFRNAKENLEELSDKVWTDQLKEYFEQKEKEFFALKGAEARKLAQGFREEVRQGLEREEISETLAERAEQVIATLEETAQRISLDTDTCLVFLKNFMNSIPGIQSFYFFIDELEMPILKGNQLFIGGFRRILDMLSRGEIQKLRLIPASTVPAFQRLLKMGEEEGGESLIYSLARRLGPIMELPAFSLEHFEEASREYLVDPHGDEQTFKIIVRDAYYSPKGVGQLSNLVKILETLHTYGKDEFELADYYKEVARREGVSADHILSRYIRNVGNWVEISEATKTVEDAKGVIDRRTDMFVRDGDNVTLRELEPVLERRAPAVRREAIAARDPVQLALDQARIEFPNIEESIRKEKVLTGFTTFVVRKLGAREAESHFAKINVHNSYPLLHAVVDYNFATELTEEFMNKIRASIPEDGMGILLCRKNRVELPIIYIDVYDTPLKSPYERFKLFELLYALGKGNISEDHMNKIRIDLKLGTVGWTIQKLRNYYTDVLVNLAYSLGIPKLDYKEIVLLKDVVMNPQHIDDIDSSQRKKLGYPQTVDPSRFDPVMDNTYLKSLYEAIQSRERVTRTVNGKEVEAVKSIDLAKALYRDFTSRYEQDERYESFMKEYNTRGIWKPLCENVDKLMDVFVALKAFERERIDAPLVIFYLFKDKGEIQQAIEEGIGLVKQPLIQFVNLLEEGELSIMDVITHIKLRDTFEKICKYFEVEKERAEHV